MKKSTLISLIALLVAVAGVLIALAAYFKKKNPLQEIINKLNFKSEDE